MSKSDARISDARKLMEINQLDFLIGFSDGSLSFTDGNVIWSLTRYTPIDETIFVLPRKDGPKLIVKTPWEAERATKYVNSDFVVAAKDVTGELRKLLENRSPNSKIAVAGFDSLNKVATDAISSFLGDTIGEADTIVSEIGKCRYPDEIELAKRAAEIAAAGYDKLLEVARPNMAEYQLAAEISSTMRSIGADDNFQIIASSSFNPHTHQPTSRVIQKDDVVLAEISPSVDGVFVQICRTAFMGDVPELFQKKYALLDESFQEGFVGATDGEKVSTLAKTMNAIISREGYDKYCKPPFMRARGHGMGLGSVAPGDVAVNNGTQLENGMMFVLHPNQYLPETGYMMCGETVIIHDTTPIRLTGKALTIESIGFRR